MKPISIIITNRNTLEFLELCIKSVRKYQTVEHELIIMDDNSSDGSKEWLEQNKSTYNYLYFTHTDDKRHGIVGMVDEGVEKASNDIVYILHSDMVCSPNFDTNLVKHLKPRTIISSTRIEPPLHPPEKCKITQAFGNFVKEFNEEAFVKFATDIQQQRKDVFTDGVFAPTLCYKSDWQKYNYLFAPQSIEDSNQWYTLKQQGYDFIQSWDSLVYHFTSRGSRFNGDSKNSLKDSHEWKLTNKKNLKNFTRIWGTTPLYTQTKHPIIKDRIPISAHVLVCERDSEFVYKFLDSIEAWFDEIVFVNDSDWKIESGQKSVKDEINRYCEDIENNGPNNFTRAKIRYYERSLNKDFASQTNYAVSKCSNTWTIKLDVDEEFSELFLNALSDTIKKSNEYNSSVVGFPRINTLNGVIVNDIPRNEWNVEDLKKYPKLNEQKSFPSYPDFQFRLHERSVKWIGKVHELPEPVARQDTRKVSRSENYFFHNKTIDRQIGQNKLYDNITKTKINNIIYDSVIFTTEGITKHAREEVKELATRGYNIQLLDWYRENDFIDDCKSFKDFYKPVDITKNDYVVICNQPPERWDKTLHLKRFIAYLAFEGVPPQHWVQKMNNDKIIEIWTPSQYCKDKFIEAGIKRPIYVIPHGVDDSIWNNNTVETKFDKFTFLWVGTAHNTRKSPDLVIKNFSEAFKGRDDVQLIMKFNNIYNPGFDADKFIQKHVVENGNQNILTIDEDTSEAELVQLYKKCHVFLSPHRAEGFGINILNALTLGMPTIATKSTGNMDFCNEENTLFVNTTKEEWAPFVYPYLDAKWVTPDEKHLQEQMKYVYHNYDKLDFTETSKKIREDWSWKKVVDKIESRLQTL